MLKVTNFYIGIFYFLMSFFGGVLGFSTSMVLSLELNNPFPVLGNSFYYTMMTLHGFIMLFVFMTPMAVGFYFYLLPGLLLIKDFSSKVLSIVGMFLVLLGLVFILFVFLILGGSKEGWTLYPPLSNSPYSPDYSLDFTMLGMFFLVMGSILSSLNILMTTMPVLMGFSSFLELSNFMWSSMLTSLLLVMATPSFLMTLMFLILDSGLVTFYFDTEFGGSVLLFQSLFWFFGHPDVYLVLIPVFGVISQVLSSICGGELFNKMGMNLSLMSLFMLSFLVYGHHMVTVGWGLDLKGFFMTSTIVMSIPTGVKVFSWLYSLFIFGGSFNIVSGFIFFFMLMFSLGGVTGVFLANFTLDNVLHDTMYVVAHFHTVLSVAAISGFMSGMFLFFKNMFGFYNKIYSLYMFFYVVLMSQLLSFMVSLHLLGMIGVSSSVSCYIFDYFFMYHFGTVSVFGMWIGVILFIYIFLLEIISIKNVNNNF